MSISSSIEIALSKPVARTIILQKLEEFGWSYSDHGKVTFLPIGDVDDFDWQHECIPLEELFKILAEKDKQKELIGVVMTWRDTNIGGTFLVRENGTIIMSPDIKRRILNVESYNKITDINWYMTKLVPVFGPLLESISYEEHV
ncbi:hypothetical protein [Paenibacillus sp. P13VS]|uniref:hypothetical protein n=1 Tax=Paenibacillus sp. P13VS TaxID=2697367 RepID=UPI00187BA158|nr:hypothetical protein [Paenibacillus sp. P13VS]MBE7682941.1 hypothetical protein [Paenibacillus sp. P13VS]